MRRAIREFLSGTASTWPRWRQPQPVPVPVVSDRERLRAVLEQRARARR